MDDQKKVWIDGEQYEPLVWVDEYLAEARSCIHGKLVYTTVDASDYTQADIDQITVHLDVRDDLGDCEQCRG